MLFEVMHIHPKIDSNIDWTCYLLSREHPLDLFFVVFAITIESIIT